jgi:hypothetical protein
MSGRKLLLSPPPDTDFTGLTPDRVASAAPETVEAAKSSMQDIQEACISAEENLEKLGYLNCRKAEGQFYDKLRRTCAALTILALLI